jgi:hypothetical protein
MTMHVNRTVADTTGISHGPTFAPPLLYRRLIVNNRGRSQMAGRRKNKGAQETGLLMGQALPERAQRGSLAARRNRSVVP